MLTAEDVHRIADEVAKLVAVAQDPEALWDSRQVGAYLDCSPRTVLEKYAPREDFPKAVRPAKGHPRFFRKEIIRWAKSYQDR